MSILRFTHICLVCVVVLAAGEEHGHNINDSTSEALIGDLAAYHEDGHGHSHDDHHHHDHSDHSHEHGDDAEHTNHKILQVSTEPEHIVDYKTWLAASGKLRSLSSPFSNSLSRRRF